MKNKEIFTSANVEENAGRKLLIPFNLQFFAGESDNNKDEAEDDAADDNTDSSEDDSEDSSKGGSGSKERTFTQKEVTRMMTREKKQGRNSVFKDLGLDEKTAKSELEAFRQWKQSQMSEEEKQAKIDAENELKIKEAEDRALRAEVKATAMQMGIKKEFVDDVMVLTMGKIKEGADVETAVSEIKEKYTMFSNDISEDNNEQSNTDTGSTVRTRKTKKEEGKGKEAGSLGKKLAANRKTTNSSNEEKRSKFF